MKTTQPSSMRRHLSVIAIAIALWFLLWLLLPHVRLPIPPYRFLSGASNSVQLLSNVWAAALIVLPGLLPALAILFARRNSISPFRHPFAACVFLLSFAPLLIVAGGAYKRIGNEPSVDSVISPLFYFYFLAPQ